MADITPSYHTVLKVTCDPTFAEILMAEVGELGFDTFQENQNGFDAYAEGERYDKQGVEMLKVKYLQVQPLQFEWEKIAKRNWNEEWEKSYEPIVVDERCIIRAHFHKPTREYPYEIIITPKMSFGTGHHQTTYLMIKNQMNIDHQDKIVMDAGCGTAVLSIMASKRGAKSVEAFDIDEWSVINSLENIEVNRCNNIHIQKGMISDLTFSDDFDLILANINKNILLQEMPQYAAYLKPGGELLLSGFYEKDLDDMVSRAHLYGFEKVSVDSKEDWACLLLRKEAQKRQSPLQGITG